MTINPGTYKDVEAVILENDTLRAVVLPRYGSKTASLVYKPLAFETLWQNPAPAYRKVDYAAAYPDGEFSGFDEMFPSISRCYYEEPPWAGTEVPDHGEVWALPWSEAVEKDSLVMSVSGVRFPYRLTKRVTLEDGTGKPALIIGYTLENLSPAEFRCIWAAHPLFNACPGMEFIVPPGMDRIINSVPGPVLGGYGRELPFPCCTGPEEAEIDLSRVPVENRSGYQKYYFAGEATKGWCALRNPENGLLITLRFPKEDVPYLGMWLNEGGWAGQYNIAPEPCSAAMDRIDFSRMWGMESSIGPNGRKEWFLRIEVGEER